MGMNTAAVQRLYVAYFNRPADPLAIGDYEAMLPTDRVATQAELLVLAETYFSPSLEYQSNFSGMGNADIVNQLYLNIFGRPADIDGLKGWTAALNDKSQTVASLALQLSYSAQGTDASVVSARIDAATAFTNGLDTAEEILAYQGPVALATATAYLEQISGALPTTTAAIEAQGAAAIAGVDTTIANVVSVGGPQGKTFELTAATDTFTTATGIADDKTTNQNDTFLADNTGVNVTNATDTLDGGGGKDTLTIYGLAAADAVPTIANIENIILDGSADDADINLSAATGLERVVNNGAVAQSSVTVASGVAVTLKSNVDATEAQNVNYGASATSASLTVNNVNTNTTKAINLDGAAVTTVNLATTGAASSLGLLDVDAAMATVNITGNQNLTIVDAVEEAVSAINAATFSGKLAVSTANQATGPDVAVGTVDVVDITVTGGTASDSINISANAADNEVVVDAGAGDDVVTIKAATAYAAATATNAGDSIKGGEGTGDVLAVAGNLDASDLSGAISGFETIRFTAAANGTSMAVNKLGITNFELEGDTVLQGLGAATTAKIGDTGVDLTATLAAAGTADTLTVTLESNTATGSAVIANSHDVLNIVSSKAATDAATVVNELENTTSATSAATLNISGDTTLVVQSAALKAAAAVDATNMSAALTSTFSTALKDYKGGSGVNTLTLAAGNLATGNTFAAGSATTDALNATTSASQNMGLISVSGFETLNLTAAGAVVADLRNVTGLNTLALTANAAATDDLTLNRLSTDTTVSFATGFDQVVTTVNSGTAMKVAVTATAEVKSLTVDAAITSLTITSDDGDTTAAEAMADFKAISGAALATITVLGKDDTDLTTLSTTVTKVDASGATGNLTVTASATATEIIGSQAADGITGGGAGDTIEGGKGDDTLSGGAGTDTYVFASTAALNGSDTITWVLADDTLSFKNFMSGGSVDQNGGAGTAIVAYAAASNSDVDIANKLALFNTGDNELTVAELVAEIEGAGNAFSLTSGGKAIVLSGDSTAADQDFNVMFVDDTLDGVNGTVSATDIVIVGVSAGNLDLDTLITTNFAFS